MLRASDGRMVECPLCEDNKFVVVVCSHERMCEICERTGGRKLTGVVVRDPKTDLPLMDDRGLPVLRYVEMDHTVARRCSCRLQGEK